MGQHRDVWRRVRWSLDSRSSSRPRRVGAAVTRIGAVGVVVAAVTTTVLAPTTVSAGPVPAPLPWQRTYVPEPPMTAEQIEYEVLALCEQADRDDLVDNDLPGVPKIAVVGDSVQNQARITALFDPGYRWRYVTHCGERFQSVLGDGRLDKALAMQPDVLIAGLGSNNYAWMFRPNPDMFPEFETSLAEYLHRTAGVPCRIIYNIPERVPNDQPPELHPVWLDLARRANALFAALDGHGGVTVVDWNAITSATPGLLFDDQHLTRKGLNARVNAGVAAARHCYPPDTPGGAHAAAGNGMASVSWTSLPPEEGVTTYRVTASTGQVATTNHATVNVAGIPNGTPVTFSVVAINQGGESTPSFPSAPVVPSATGARFHAMAPHRVLDTRDGTGGKPFAFWPGESYTLSLNGALPPEAASASAVVLNVTATGQTSDTFVTVWPGGDSRPLTSNLNPHPGVVATPAMATTRLGPDQTVQLFNNTGFVHLVADVVGWYDQPGSGKGSLYTPRSPVRVLDSRDGTGGRSTRFSTTDTMTSPWPGSRPMPPPRW